MIRIHIPEPDQEIMALAETRELSLAKPPRSLGRLEDLAAQVCGIAGSLYASVERRRVLVFASDNGIVEEGVASAPKSVTRAQAINISRGLTGVGVIAKHFNAEVEVWDVGIDGEVNIPSVINAKIAYGTRNFAHEPAMTREQAEQAIEAGLRAAKKAQSDGIQILGIGEMGIGNTSTSAAVLSALLGVPSDATVGRGGGVNDKGFLRKKQLVDEAIARFKPDSSDAVDVLSKVGGFDLCAMAGAFLGAAENRIPVVIDGYISAVAALCAYRIDPRVKPYLIPSHVSTEGGYALAMNALGLQPILHLNMRLGEGSGCPIAFEIVSAALDVLQHMATFAEARIDDGYLGEIRSNSRFQA